MVGKYSLKNERKFLQHCIDELSKSKLILDAGGGPGFWEKRKGLQRPKSFDQIKSLRLDINPNKNPDILADIHNLRSIRSNTFDGIICTEVLEHAYNPFIAVKELRRILKPKGKIFFSAPFMYPYHHWAPKEPYPGLEKVDDYYRYTEMGWKHLLKDFKKVETFKIGTYADVFLHTLTGFKLKRTNPVYKVLRFFVNLIMMPFVGRGVQFKNTCLNIMVLAEK